MPQSGPQANSCHSCGLRPICIAGGLAAADVNLLGAVLRRRTPLGAGEHLYWEGDSFEAVFAVRRGGIKSYTTDLDGNERVRGFHLPGDLFGLDALHAGRHPASAQALAETEVCVLPYTQLERLADTVPGLQHRLFSLMSRDFALALALAGEYTAEQRLAAFLLHLTARTIPVAQPVDTLVLDMGRRDIGNYLRLVTETVSRVLKRFRDEGLIAVDRREIQILDRAGLTRIASPVGINRQPAAALPSALFQAA